MIPRLILAALLIGIASATAQNYGAPRGDYARSIGERYQSSDATRPVRSGNPMIQVCPDGWSYGPTISGTQPKCVAPEEGK